MLRGATKLTRRRLLDAAGVALAVVLAVAVVFLAGRRNDGPLGLVTIDGGGGGDVAASLDSTTFRAVYARVAPGVVSVSVTTRPIAPEAPQGLPGPLGQRPDADQLRPQLVRASGVVIDTEGCIVTAHHAIVDADRVRVTFADGATRPARIVGSDPSTDLALLRVDRDAAELHPVPLGQTRSLRVGDPVLAIGDPFGYARSASAGVVSGLGRSIDAPNGFTILGAIQTDAAVNHGNSGGALVDASGRLVGIPVQIAESGVDANVGVAFALPVETVRSVAAELDAKGVVRRAWLGVHGVAITPALADVVPELPQSGALVTEVLAGGPAAAAGIRGGTGTAWVDGGICVGGDAIVAMNGTPVSGMDDVLRRIRDTEIGQRVSLTLIRDGVRRQVIVTVDAQPPAHPGIAEGCSA